MAKFLSRLFSGSGSSSSKRSSFRSSQTSINDNSRRTGASSNVRSAASLENLSSYHINPKELDKNKLHKASWEGNIDKVERLARPDQIDLRDQHYRTPLHLAVVRGHLEIVRYLVHEGAKLDVVDNEKRTPLVKAVLSGNQNPQVNYQICIALLRGGADAFINAVDSHGKNALHYAIDFANEALVDIFLSVPSCDLNFKDRDQMTPLHLAVKRNSPNIVHLLLSDQHEQQADPNITNRNGQTPLHMAATVGYIEIIRVLLQANLDEPCDPTIVDVQQLTAYQIAKDNHHEACAKLIDEYQHGWTSLTPRRDTSVSVNDQQINPVITNRSGMFEAETSEESSESHTSQSSKSSSKQVKRSTNQLSDRTIPSTSAPKQEQRSLADMIKSNPLQPDVHKTNVSNPGNQTLASLIKNNPLQSENSKTNVSKPANQTLTGLMHHIPLQPDETSASKPATPQQTQQPFMFGIGPVLQRKETDHTSTSVSIEKSLINANPLLERPGSPKKNVAINSVLNSLPRPEMNAQNSNSWTHDSTATHKTEQNIKQARKMDTWDSSSGTQSDDEDTGVYRTKLASTNFHQAHSSLNGTAMFTTTPINHNLNDSKSDEDSIEAAVQKLNTQKVNSGVQSLVNKQIGVVHKVTPSAQSPRSEELSWSTSSVTANKESVTKGISSLIHQQPLLSKKSSVSTWDDSRPLSADLQRTTNNKSKSQTSSSSDDDDDDDDDDKKSSTIVKSPITSGVLSNIVQTNIRTTGFTEPATTGVENLTKMMESIVHSSTSNQKQSPPPKTIATLMVTPLVRRSDSLSSNASSTIDDTIRTSAIPPPVTATHVKQQLYHEDIYEQHWPEITSDTSDFRLITRKYSNEMIQHSQQQSSRASLQHDLNSLRGSMSSSTSSVQNNMERLSEIKEDIKQIERKQEDSLELKRQLKDMENKKNNFEALYKKNDQLLRETESKLEKEINEKQRLEWTTKNLNMELKSVKQKLHILEEEKDELNQRCVRLKEERETHEEKLRMHQANSLQSAATGVLREEDIDKIKLRHREEMKLLSAENDDLHHRTKQLQNDLQLHKESLDVTVRYKIDLEKALEEKTYLQHELDRLKHEKDFIEQEKVDYKAKYDHLQDEIRVILLDRSKLEQKLTNDLQEQTKQRQRSTDDIRKYKTQIEQLNIKLGDAEARLLVLQTQNEALIISKDREMKNEFETLTHRLNTIESDKLNAEQRYHNEHKEITDKQQQKQHVVREPLVFLTSTPISNAAQHQHSPSSPCIKCNTLQRSYDFEREHRLQTEKDNERLRDVVSRQKQQQFHSSLQQQENEHVLTENSKQIRSETERVKYELDRLRHDFDKLITNYEPPNNLHQQAQLHSQIETLRQFYEQEYRQRQSPLSNLPNGINSSATTMNGYHRTSSPMKHDGYDHSPNGSVNCSICSNSRLLKERLDNAIDTSLADQRIKTIKQMPILPRQSSPLLTTNNNTTSSVQLLRKRYYV